MGKITVDDSVPRGIQIGVAFAVVVEVTVDESGEAHMTPFCDYVLSCEKSGDRTFFRMKSSLPSLPGNCDESEKS